MDVLLKRRLRFSGSYRIVIAGQHQALHPFWQQLEQTSEFSVLSEQVWDGEFFVLAGVNTDAVHTIAGEDEVLDRLRQRVAVKPTNHFVPLCFKEGFGTDVDVGEEGNAHSLLCTDLLMFGFQRKMEVIHVENIPCL